MEETVTTDDFLILAREWTKISESEEVSKQNKKEEANEKNRDMEDDNRKNYSENSKSIDELTIQLQTCQTELTETKTEAAAAARAHERFATRSQEEINALRKKIAEQDVKIASLEAMILKLTSTIPAPITKSLPSSTSTPSSTSNFYFKHTLSIISTKSTLRGVHIEQIKNNSNRILVTDRADTREFEFDSISYIASEEQRDTTPISGIIDIVDTLRTHTGNTATALLVSATTPSYFIPSFLSLVTQTTNALFSVPHAPIVTISLLDIQNGIVRDVLAIKRNSSASTTETKTIDVPILSKLGIYITPPIPPTRVAIHSTADIELVLKTGLKNRNLLYTNPIHDTNVRGHTLAIIRTGTITFVCLALGIPAWVALASGKQDIEEKILSKASAALDDDYSAFMDAIYAVNGEKNIQKRATSSMANSALCSAFAIANVDLSVWSQPKEFEKTPLYSLFHVTLPENLSYDSDADAIKALVLAQASHTAFSEHSKKFTTGKQIIDTSSLVEKQNNDLKRNVQNISGKKQIAPGTPKQQSSRASILKKPFVTPSSTKTINMDKNQSVEISSSSRSKYSEKMIENENSSKTVGSRRFQTPRSTRSMSPSSTQKRNRSLTPAEFSVIASASSKETLRTRARSNSLSKTNTSDTFFRTEIVDELRRKVAAARTPKITTRKTQTYDIQEQNEENNKPMSILNGHSNKKINEDKKYLHSTISTSNKSQPKINSIHSIPVSKKSVNLSTLDIDHAIKQEIAAQKKLLYVKIKEQDNENTTSTTPPLPPTPPPTSNPVPGMQMLLVSIATKAKLAGITPDEIFQRMDTMFKEVGLRGPVNEYIFTSVLRQSIPGYTADEAYAAILRMHLKGATDIDYADFLIALNTLAQEQKLV